MPSGNPTAGPDAFLAVEVVANATTAEVGADMFYQ